MQEDLVFLQVQKENIDEFLQIVEENIRYLKEHY
jgi:hypothetical protein